MNQNQHIITIQFDDAKDANEVLHDLVKYTNLIYSSQNTAIVLQRKWADEVRKFNHV